MAETVTPPALILVVDDDVGLSRLMGKALGREGFATVTANSGQGALSWLATNTADLMLLDLKLPDIKGKDIVNRLAETGRSVPFVIITGQGDERIAVEMMKSGARDYLIKDGKLMDFVPAIVRRVLEQIKKEKRLEREILEISERELSRIGRDFHDGLGQQLTALELYTTGLLTGVREQAPKLVKPFQDMASKLRLVIRQARALSHGLAPVSLDGHVLVNALHELAESTRTMTKIGCAFDSEPEPQIADPIVATHLYRIAQEAVNNALKHSRAKKIRISLVKDGDGLIMKVCDDGCGIRPRIESESGIGLQMMQYRADLIRASLKVESLPKKGTSVICSYLPAS